MVVRRRRSAVPFEFDRAASSSTSTHVGITLSLIAYNSKERVQPFLCHGGRCRLSLCKKFRDSSEP